MKSPEEILLDSSFGITLNANDFFGYACGDEVYLDVGNYHWAIPIIKEYGVDGISAVMSHVRGGMPLKPYRTKEFNKAMKELKEINPIVYREEY